MEKRYQVFISSTFQDLQNARQEVSQALLRADCFPAGMELFPAADEEQFEFIKTVIDQSDYYIIISAGRYGTIHAETGLSYTEMEYDYAVQTGKPVIRLLHKDPFNELKGEFIEKTDEGREKLQAFRNRLKTDKLVRFWSSPNDLMNEVLFALADAKERFPSEGWLRSDVSEVAVDKEYIKGHLTELDSILRNFKSKYVEIEKYQEALNKLELRNIIFGGLGIFACGALGLFLLIQGVNLVEEFRENSEYEQTISDMAIYTNLNQFVERGSTGNFYTKSGTGHQLEPLPFEGSRLKIELDTEWPKIPEASKCKTYITFTNWTLVDCVVREQNHRGWVPSDAIDLEWSVETNPDP